MTPVYHFWPSRKYYEAFQNTETQFEEIDQASDQGPETCSRDARIIRFETTMINMLRALMGKVDRMQGQAMQAETQIR